MPPITGFVAFPSSPRDVGQTIRAALDIIQPDANHISLASWEESDIAGRFLVDPILSQIDVSDCLVADITYLNFNVTFEIGYAIGRQKRVVLIKNETLLGNDEQIREIGLFDTLGYANYSNSHGLATVLRTIADIDPIPFDVAKINTAAPVYIIFPRLRTDVEIRLLARIKKARLMFRSFDADETGRLAAREAIENVASSYGVVLPLLTTENREAKIHNYRVAFVAGFSMALGKTTLILQRDEDPVPLDYRDLVRSFRSLEQIDEHVADFSAVVAGLFQTVSAVKPAGPQTLLERLTLGASAAENEMQELQNYYIETDEYWRALRGEVRVVTGRKGAGKTALFVQVRNKIRQDRKKVVVDLKPEGFQLLKFKEQVLDYLAEGTREHTITAFWEYLLLLETCYKLLEKDRDVHMNNSKLYKPYRALADAYENDEYVSEGDFSERMVKLTQRIANDFAKTNTELSDLKYLKTGEITELLYKHDLNRLRKNVIEYLGFKNGLWILFDNLDKGWPPNGVTSEDVLSLRCLLDAIGKLENDLRVRQIECHGTVFIRNDVFELLVEATSDRGKTASAIVDWTDPDMLRELLRRRFLFTADEFNNDASFDEIWRQICTSHIRGEETSQYLIDRSLMRPRAIIELLRHCRAHAINLGHKRIEESDIEQGEEIFSIGVLNNVDFELQDVFPSSTNLLYEFIESREILNGKEITDLLAGAVSVGDVEKVFSLLLWYGFFGIVREDGETMYIYTVRYDMKILVAMLRKRGVENTSFRINPAFWRALEIQRDRK